MNKVRFAVISDIHGNYEALIKAMSIIKRRKVDRVICLGDTIGYGPNPNECLEYIKKHIDIILCGNHDIYQVDRPENIENLLCRVSTEWTGKVLDKKWIDYIKTLPMSYSWREYGFYHTEKKATGDWLHLNNTKDILSAFFHKEKVCFYGHTHRSRIIVIENDKVIQDTYPISTLPFMIDLKNQRAFINPGSIGQQRDHKTDLSFAVCEQDNNILKVNIERHRYCSIKTYVKIRHQGCGDAVADYLIREDGKKKMYRIIIN